MADKKKLSGEKQAKKKDELSEFNKFVRRTKTQNETLKKIMDKLNSANNSNQ